MSEPTPAAWTTNAYTEGFFPLVLKGMSTARLMNMLTKTTTRPGHLLPCWLGAAEVVIISKPGRFDQWLMDKFNHLVFNQSSYPQWYDYFSTVLCADDYDVYKSAGWTLPVLKSNVEAQSRVPYRLATQLLDASDESSSGRCCNRTLNCKLDT